mgnify:CR=1 FL=1
MKSVSFIFLAAVAWGNCVMSFDAPCPSVSGMASGEDLLWLLDPLNDVVYGMETVIPQATIVKIINVPFDNPDNLAYAEGKLYLTDGNSTVIHSVTVDGEVWSSMDVGGMGIQSIEDLGYEAHSYGSNRCMFVLDSTQNIVFNLYPLDTFANIEICTSVADAPQCYGIAGCGEIQGVWIACGSENPNLQLWYEGNFNWEVSIAGANMVTEIAQDATMMPQEFMWAYCQTFNTVFLEYYGMALERSTWGEIKASL